MSIVAKKITANGIIPLKKKPNAYIILKNKKEAHKGGKNMALKGEKNFWILLLFILGGIVVGGLLGNLASNVDFLSWLSYGEQFGLTTPIELDLSVIKFTIGFMFKINIASIIGIVLAIFIYKKI